MISLVTAGYFLFFVSQPVFASGNVLVNGSFESQNLEGWIIEGDVSIISTTLDAFTNEHLQSTAEGQYAAKIGDEIPWAIRGPVSSAIVQEAIVPPLREGQDHIVIQFSYAVVANDPPSHPTEEKPLFNVLVLDKTTEETLYDTDFVYTSQTSGEWYLGQGANENISQQGFSFLSGDRWVFKPWEIVEIDLTDRIGHLIRLEFRVRDCTYSAHAAYGYLDAVHLGPPVPISVPALIGDPVPAEFIEPNAINRIMHTVEHLRLWPWVLCCLPLLLLPLLGLLLGRNRSEPSSPPPYSLPTRDIPPKRPRTKQEGGGFRPKEKKSRQGKSSGGFRLPD